MLNKKYSKRKSLNHAFYGKQGNSGSVTQVVRDKRELTIVIELPWNFCITNQSNLKDVTPQLNVILTQNVITSTQTAIKY